ncbi:CHAT domain-containing protein [Streptomyces sp. NPDC127108]|uniref:CHAT domain-containing protein n=1 Tax=Streptomyces sp. NPDC127108 TaxID=3345361 RepID=UPI003636AF76
MPTANDHAQDWTRLAARTDQVVTAGRTWLRTRRLPDFDTYADAAIPLIEEELPAYLARWGHRSPGPGLDPVPVPPAQIAIPLVQQHQVAADHHTVAGRLPEARTLRTRGEALADRHLTDVQRAEHWSGVRAEHLFGEGKVARALEVLGRADGLLCAHGRRLEAVSVRLLHAGLLRELGDHDKALLLLRGFEESLGSEPPDADQVRAARLAAEARIREAAGPGAAEAVARAVELERRSQLHQRLRGLKAGLLADTGRYAEAERLFQELLPFMGPFAEFHLASLAWRRGEGKRAAELLDALAPVFEGSAAQRRALSGFPANALAYRRNAYCLLRARLQADDRPTEALEWCDQGLSATAEFPDPELEWKLHGERARRLRRADRPLRAQDAYREAVRLIDRRRRVSIGLRWDNSYLAERLPVLYEALDLAVERRDAATALALTDMLKARSFAARLALLPVPGAEAPTADERELAEVTAAINALEHGGAKTPETEGGPDAAARATGSAALRARRRALVERIRRDDPRWRAVSEGPPVDLEESARQAAERVWRTPGAPGARDAGAAGVGKRAALSLYRRKGRIVAVVVSADGVEVAAKTLSAETERALAAHAKRLRPGAGGDGGGSGEELDFSTAFGVALEDLVPRRFVATAVGADTLLVSPHAELHGLPWQLLTALGKPLVRHTAVGVLPNLTVLTALDRPPARSVRVSLFGAPDHAEHQGLKRLREPERELRDLEAVYGGGRLLSPTAMGPGACVRRLLDLLDRQGGPGTVLHLACHATGAGSDPYDAGLHLTDGTLSMAQLAVRRVRYDEVVLAVCAGALRPGGTVRAEGRVRLVGDDAITLAHVFQEAGAAFVLGSPAPVGDRSARAFALAWHRHRADGTSPLRSAREAARELLDDGRYARHNWAGLTGFGCR